MRVSILAMGAVISICAGASFANAQDQSPPQATINVNDLDLTQPSGQMEAEKRLQASAASACHGGQAGVEGANAEQSCRDDLIQKGRADIARVAAQQSANKQAAQRSAYAAGYDAGSAHRRSVVHHTMRHHVTHHIVHHRKAAAPPT